MDSNHQPTDYESAALRMAAFSLAKDLSRGSNKSHDLVTCQRSLREHKSGEFETA